MRQNRTVQRDLYNFRFGAKYRSPVTGIIYNNEMDDFSKPGEPDKFGVGPSPSNFVKPGKRPQSSISPVVFTDKDGAVQLVAGASGGKRITTAIALVREGHSSRVSREFVINFYPVHFNFRLPGLSKLF